MNKQLRLARINKHVSEREVCRVIDADLRTYQHWEQGHHVPQPSFRKKWCAFFGLSLEELGFDPRTLLFTGTRAVSPSAPSRASAATAETDAPAIPTDLLELALLALRIGQQERG